MTAATLTTRLAPAPTVSFGRLTRVEFRKFFDTRAGLWLMISMVAITVLIAGGLAMFFKKLPEEIFTTYSWFGMAPFLLIGINLLLPVMAILLVTTEWSQRTTLTTFVLEPRRGRVIAAKAVVLAVVTLAAFALTVALAAATYSVGNAIAGTSAVWTTPWPRIGGHLAGLALSMAMAFGFALLLMNTPAAIVLYMALPIVPQTLLLIPSVRNVLPWIDLNTAQQPVMAGTISGNEWLKLAVASLIWIIVPAAAGVWRHLRAEAK